MMPSTKYMFNTCWLLLSKSDKVWHRLNYYAMLIRHSSVPVQSGFLANYSHICEVKINGKMYTQLQIRGKGKGKCSFANEERIHNSSIPSVCSGDPVSIIKVIIMIIIAANNNNNNSS